MVNPTYTISTPKRTVSGRPNRIERYKHGKEYRRLKNELTQLIYRNQDVWYDEMITAGVILLAGVEVGTGDVYRIYRHLGYNIPKSHIKEASKRLHDNGVWKDDTTHCGWMEEYGYLAFMMDAMIVTGILQRA